LTRLNILRGGFATKILSFGVDAIKKRRSDLTFYIDMGFLEVFGEDR